MASVRRTSAHRVIATIMTLATAVVLALATSPPTNAATWHETSVFSGELISSGGSSMSADGCRETTWFIQAGKSYDGTNFASYYRSTWDICYSEAVESASGETHSDVSLESTPLRSARVVATVPITDSRTGDPAGEVRIDNTFSAYGPAHADQYASVDRFGDMMLQITSSGTWREATSIGGMKMDFATLTRGTSHTLVLMHGWEF